MYVAAIASDKTELASKQLTLCEQTWSNTVLPKDNFYFIFGTSSNEEFIKNNKTFKNINKQIINNKIFYDVQDVYDENNFKFNVTYKTLLSIRDFLDTSHTHYVRTHTGSYLNLNILSKYCDQLPMHNLYAGVRGKAFERNETIMFCSGACFILSRDVAQKVWDNHEEILDLYKNRIHRQNNLDDVFLGSIIFSKFKIPIIELPRIEVRNTNFNFNNTNFHYLFVDKYKSIQENWYFLIHQRFGFA